jgi:hypothetical protein
MGNRGIHLKIERTLHNARGEVARYLSRLNVVAREGATLRQPLAHSPKMSIFSELYFYRWKNTKASRCVLAGFIRVTTEGLTQAGKAHESRGGEHAVIAGRSRCNSTWPKNIHSRRSWLSSGVIVNGGECAREGARLEGSVS